MARDYYSASPPDPEEPRMKVCPECGGHGAVSFFDLVAGDRNCPTCHGTGEVEDDRECDPGPDTLEERDGLR